MKVLRVIPSMNPKFGGPSQGVRNSIPELKKLGIDNEVVCFDNLQDKFLNDSPFVIHALGPSKTSWAYNKMLKSWLEKHLSNYDVVIIHGLWLYHSYATIKVIKKKQRHGKVPKVYIMPHGMLDPWFQRDKTRKIKAFRNEIYWRLIERKVVNSADGLLFTCEQELQLAKNTFKGYRPNQELNVSYGVQNPPIFTKKMNSVFSSKMVALGDKPYLLFLSRIHPKKGVDLLIDAYIKLSAKGLSLPDLVIAGPVDGEYAEHMVAKGKSCEKIHFSGMLSGDAKWGAFYGCEAFILPSHQENFGISVVEALACAKPVLISDQVNIFKEIESGGGGLVDTDNLQGVENLLLNWNSLTLPEKQEMSDKAKSVYLNNYSIEQTAEILKRILKEQMTNA